VRRIDAVSVKLPYRNSRSKWLDGSRVRYEGDTEIFTYNVGREPLEVHSHQYNWQQAFLSAGLEPPIVWDNRKPPVQQVLDNMVMGLARMAPTHKELCLWEEAFHCYPPVAKQLKHIFTHSVMIAANDNGGCKVHKEGWSAIATMPSAQYFDSVIHGNIIWKTDGAKTADMYRSLGVTDLYYATQPMSPSFGDRLTALKFDFEHRLEELKKGRYIYDFSFVGSAHGDYRYVLNLPETTALFQAKGVRTVLYGAGMRDGSLLPHESDNVDIWGMPVADLYLNSFATANVPFIGLLSMRLYDAWETGTLLIQHDPVGELDDFGIEPDVHYASYDGSVADMIRVIKYYQQHMSETERILRAGFAKGREMQLRYSKERTIEDLLNHHSHKWGY